MPRSPITNIPHQSGTLVTGDELTPTHPNHPKATARTESHSWRCVVYAFGQMYNNVYPAFRRHPGEHCTPLKVLWTLYCIPPPGHPPRTPHKHWCSYWVRRFALCSVWRGWRHSVVAFSGGLLSPSDAHVSSWPDDSFHFSPE